LAHERIDEAWAGFAIPVGCELGPDVPATRVVLFYRSADREEFEVVEMQSRAGGWSGNIPEEATHGRYLHYYLEAHDRRGRAVAQSGSAASPNLMMLQGMNPRAPTDVKKVSKEREEVGRRWTATVGMGTGVGILGGVESANCGANPDDTGCFPIDEDHDPVPVNSGAAFAPLHLVAEAGYRLTSRWEASAQLRFQVVSGTTVKDFDDKTFLGTARLRRWLGQGRMRLFFAAAVGGGQVSHGVDLGPAGGGVRDALKSGMLAFGGGGGAGYNIIEGLWAVAALDALVLLPDNTSFHADLNLGLRYAF
jgi:hypothetical protein